MSELKEKMTPNANPTVKEDGKGIAPTAPVPPPAAAKDNGKGTAEAPAAPPSAANDGGNGTAEAAAAPDAELGRRGVRLPTSTYTPPMFRSGV
jgi:hypothetical protein